MEMQTGNWTELSGCRLCGRELDPLLDLGPIVLSSFLDPDQPDPPSVPLDTVVCSRCGLVQLRHTVHPDLLYRNYGYWYRSAISEVMQRELTSIAEAVLAEKPRVVLDLGANDGTLLKLIGELERYPPVRCAVEPAGEFATALREVSDWRAMDYFPLATAQLASHSVSVITSIACFYNVPDPLSYVEEVSRLLSDEGVWIVQMQDLGQMVAATAFDNICPEHLCTYSASTFAKALEGSDLAIRSIERRAINGGSLRFTVTKRPGAVASYIQSCDGPTDPDSLARFVWRVGEQQRQIRAVVEAYLDRGESVDIYGASTKASTLLQACGLNHSQIRCAAERTQEKVGRVTSGTRIPIISEEDWRVNPASASLAVIWQFRDNILRREQEYLFRGGTFVFPLPVVEAVSYGQQVER